VKASDVKITEQWLRERVDIVVDEDGREHWVWKLAAPKDCPRGHMKDGSVHGKQFNVLPAVWRMAYPRHELTQSVRLVRTCEHALCVHWGCLTREKRSADRVGVPRPLLTRKKIAQVLREKSPITEDMVQRIRSEDKSIRKIAAELDMHATEVWRIRVQVRRMDFDNPYLAHLA
jgi:hypothetical protein